MSADRLVDAVADHCAVVVMCGGVEPTTAIHIVGGRRAFLVGVLVDDVVVAKGEGPTRQQAIDDARVAFVAWSDRELDEEQSAVEGLANLARVAKVIPIRAEARR